MTESVSTSTSTSSGKSILGNSFSMFISVLKFVDILSSTAGGLQPWYHPYRHRYIVPAGLRTRPADGRQPVAGRIGTDGCSSRHSPDSKALFRAGMLRDIRG